MINWFINLAFPLQAFIATIFTFSITSLGAAVVFLFRKINKSFMDAMLGFSAGVMIAASFFSLLSPAVEMAKKLNLTGWVVTSIGVILGGILLFVGDKVFDIIETNKKVSTNSGFKRCLMLVTSITIHNIPEGLAIGVAFGSLAYNLDGATIEAAWMLAIGIGIQNFPEGMSISLPLRREGLSRKKAFLFGVLSGVVEPIASVVGAILVMKVQILLPYLLSFAAGAMIYVVVEELIPESQTNKKKALMAFFTLIGFTIMMILDIALG